ncbi:CvpA family protein [Pararhizobium sp. IMCC21322]|uniref:CvpA family protein n=1 Tax=Pararhizobium sp. IMCC21322 TaxID=3067903 RepID=UPI002740FE99|nr:CvpA family protein [Pararhizobium sp. IMCC21322]
MSITILDGVLLGVMLISAFLAMMRGFIREVFSIGTWIAAAAAALFFHSLLVPYVEPYVGNDLLSQALSAAAVFFVTLILVSFVTIRISDFILDSGVGPIDRTLGFMFGALRGLLIVVVAMMLFNGLVQREKRPAWVTNALSLPILMEIGGRITAALPEDLQSTITEFFGSSSEPDNTVLPNDDPDSSVPAPNLSGSGASVPRSSSPDNSTSGTSGSTTPANPTIQDSEELPALQDDDTTSIPQDDTRNVERIINASPET